MPTAKFETVLQEEKDARSRSLRSVFRNLSSDSAQVQFEWTYAMRDALNPDGPHKDQALPLSHLLQDCGLLRALVELASSELDFVAYNTFQIAQFLVMLDHRHGLQMIQDGMLDALLKGLAPARLTTQRHAAALALGALALGAGVAVRDGFLPSHDPWTPLLDLAAFSGSVLRDEVAGARAARGRHQVNILRPLSKTPVDDVLADLAVVEAIVRDGALEALANLVQALADVAKEKVKLLTSAAGARLVTTFLDVAGGVLPSHCPQSTARFHAARGLACLCHVPPQVDVSDDRSAEYKVADGLARLGAPAGLVRAATRVTGERQPERQAFFAALSSDQERKDAELRHIDTLLFLADGLANLTVFPHVCKTMVAAVPILAGLVRGNEAQWAGDAGKIEQANAHFKTLGCPTVALPFHVTHFAPSAFYSAMVALSNLAGKLSRNADTAALPAVADAIQLVATPWMLEQRRSAAVISKESGNELFKLGDFESALWRYTKAAHLQPTRDAQMAIFLSNRAECFLQMRLYADALDDAQDALSINPEHAKSQSRLERAKEGLGVATPTKSAASASSAAPAASAAPPSVPAAAPRPATPPAAAPRVPMNPPLDGTPEPAPAPPRGPRTPPEPSRRAYGASFGGSSAAAGGASASKPAYGAKYGASYG